MPPSSPAERNPKPLVPTVSPAPIEAVPPLPWRPRLEHSLFREPLWLLFVFGTGLTVSDLIQADQVPWYRWASGPVALGLLWNAMKVAFERLTVIEGGVVVRGPLLRRRYTWKAIEGVQRHGKKKVTLDLGHRGTKTFEFDGRNTAPTADQVAGVVERLRLYNTSALTSYRVSLSWGAAVFLPAVAAVAAATAWALIKG